MDQSAIVQELINRAWKDEAFKNRLLKDPKAVLKEMGHNVPDSLQIEFHENSAAKVHVVIPANPADARLSDAELDNVSGGIVFDTWGQGASTCVNVTGC